MWRMSAWSLPAWIESYLRIAAVSSLQTPTWSVLGRRASFSIQVTDAEGPLCWRDTSRWWPLRLRASMMNDKTLTHSHEGVSKRRYAFENSVQCTALHTHAINTILSAFSMWIFLKSSDSTRLGIFERTNVTASSYLNSCFHSPLSPVQSVQIRLILKCTSSRFMNFVLFTSQIYTFASNPNSWHRFFGFCQAPARRSDFRGL